MTSSYTVEIYSKFKLGDITKAVAGGNNITELQIVDDKLKFSTTNFDDINYVDLYVSNSLVAKFTLASTVYHSDVITFTAIISQAIDYPTEVTLEYTADELIEPHYAQTSGINYQGGGSHFEGALYGKDFTGVNKIQFQVDFQSTTVPSSIQSDHIIVVPNGNNGFIKAINGKSPLSSVDKYAPSSNFVCSPKRALELLSITPSAVGYKSFLGSDPVHGLYICVVLNETLIFIGSNRWPTVEAWNVRLNWSWSRPLVLRHFNTLFLNGHYEGDNCIEVAKAPQFHVNPSSQLSDRVLTINPTEEIKVMGASLSGSSDFGYVAYGIESGEVKGTAYNLLASNIYPGSEYKFETITDETIDRLLVPLNYYYTFYPDEYDSIKGIIDANRAAFRFKDYFSFNSDSYSVYENKIIHLDDEYNPTKLTVISTLNTKYSNFGNEIKPRTIAQLNLEPNLNKFKIEFDNDIIEVYQNNKTYTFNQSNTTPDVSTTQYLTLRYRGVKVNLTEDGEFYA